MCQVANGLDRRGHHLTVIGGDPDRMRCGARRRDRVPRRPPRSSGPPGCWPATRPRRRGPRPHDRGRGRGVAGPTVPAGPHRGHPPLPRRTGAAAPWPGSLAQVTSRSLARDIAISQFVAHGVPGPVRAALQRGARPAPGRPGRAGLVLMLNRLTAEKRPELGIRAWAASGLGEAGWRLVVAGVGRPDAVDDDSGPCARRGRQCRLRRPGRRHRQAARRVVGRPGHGPGGALRSLGGRGHGPGGAGGGRRRRRPPRDGRRRRLLFSPGDVDAGPSRVLVRWPKDPACAARWAQRLRERQQRMFSIRAAPRRPRSPLRAGDRANRPGGERTVVAPGGVDLWRCGSPRAAGRGPGPRPVSRRPAAPERPEVTAR